MTQPESINDPRSYAEQVLNDSKNILHTAVGIVYPGDPELDPLVAFPAPNVVRDQDPGLPLSDDQEAALREAVAELGFGRTTDRTLSEQGVIGAHVIIEGGQPHKMLSEALLVLEDKDAKPTTLIVAASRDREIDTPAELAMAERLFGTTSVQEDGLYSEYLMAQDLIRSLPGFSNITAGVERVPENLPISYDTITNDFAVSEGSTNQFALMGTIGDIPVILLRVDGENYLDETGAKKHRNAPGTADLLRIVSAVNDLRGDYLLPVALATSGTYEMSRKVDAVRAALDTDKLTAITTYGTERLAAVKGEAVPAPAPINQLPGELHKMAVHLQKLEAVLAR